MSAHTVRNPGSAPHSVQESSFGESVSTLGFGARVSEVCLGAAKRNCESGAVFEAREATRRQEREAERAAREVRGRNLLP